MKKFNEFINESDENRNEISEEKVNGITSSLRKTNQILQIEKDKLSQLVSDLEMFISDENMNDQIDDSYVSLQEVGGLISEAITKIGEIDTQMNNYLKKGSDFLY